MRKPKVLVVADVPGWAWDVKARAYQALLAETCDVSLCYASQGCPPFSAYDLVHLFEVSQLRLLDHPWAPRPYKLVAGLTAHVWETWGPLQMTQWAGMVDALHGNSVLLVADLAQFHPRVYYTPNGVDSDFFTRREPYPSPLTFGHVGKPNPRKGGSLIIEAARLARVPLKLVQRTAKVALSRDAMQSWYQGIAVMVCASNMDGTPNPMLEGASTGCALLSTPIGNMPEFITDRVNGRLLRHRLPRGGAPEQIQFEHGRLVAELAACMRELADAPAVTEAMGLAARRTVLESWTWPQQVRYVLAMWQAVLG